MGEVGVQLDADVGVESLHQPQRVVGVEDEGDFQRVNAGKLAGGLADELVVNALLDFLVQQRVIGGQRIEGRVPKFGGFFDVAGIQPQARAGLADFAPFGVVLDGDAGLAEWVVESAADKFADAFVQSLHGHGLQTGCPAARAGQLAAIGSGGGI